MNDRVHFRLNATLIKNWYQYGCDRQILFGGTSPNELSNNGIMHTQKVNTWSFYGQSFEFEVVQTLGPGVLRFPENLSGAWRHAISDFVKGRRQERYMVGANVGGLAAGGSLPLPDHLRVGASKPDVVRIDEIGGERLLTICEIKAVRHATRFHKAQVAFYAELLEHILERDGSPLKLNPIGEIWRLPAEGEGAALYEVEPFDLNPYRRMVRDMLARDIPRIFGSTNPASLEASSFHLYFKCEECGFLRHCRGSIDRDDASSMDVSAVAGLSTEAKRELVRLGIRTVGSLAAKAGLHAIPGLSWSLKRNAKALVARANALASNEILRTPEPYSMLMPPEVDVAIFLIADYDPVEDSLVSIGCRIIHRNGMLTEPHIAVLKSGGANEADALANVFSIVLGELARIDGHNGALAPDDQNALRAHLFVYEPAEANAIKDAVKRHVDDIRIRAGLLDMVRLFPPTDVIPEPEYRGVQHLPATALRTVVEHLFALPTKVSNDLARVTAALKHAGEIERAYEPQGVFARPFSSMLAMEVIRTFRSNKGTADHRRAIEADVRARLVGAQAVCEWIWRQSAALPPPDGPLLRLVKKPFRFWQTFDPLDAGDLDVLRALSLIENRTAILERLVQLARPTERRADLKRAITGMTLLDVKPAQQGKVRLFFAMPSEFEDAEIGPQTFAVVLTDGDYEVLLNPARWREVNCQIDRMGSQRVEVLMHKSLYDSDFRPMLVRSRSVPGVWCLDEVIRDVNTPRVSGFLAFLAQSEAV